MERYNTRMYMERGMTGNAVTGSMNTGNSMTGNANMGSMNMPNSMAGGANMGSMNMPNSMAGNANMGSMNMPNSMAGNANMGSAGNSMIEGATTGPFEGCDGFPIAMAYVPTQKWQNIYKADVALMKGTVFPELYLPFLGKGAGMNGR